MSSTIAWIFCFTMRCTSGARERVRLACREMLREQLPPHKTSTNEMPAYKAVYVSVNKAASTSLKWLVAEIGRAHD